MIKTTDTVLAAAHTAARGWMIFPARFVLDNKTGKWEKSVVSAKSSNGRAWGMTRTRTRSVVILPSRAAVRSGSWAVNNIVIQVDAQGVTC
jgi:hypothetical protein